MTSPTAQAGIGKIVRSESHVRYTCQVYGPGEVAAPPEPADYGFGSFVRVPLRSSAPQFVSDPPAGDASTVLGPRVLSGFLLDLLRGALFCRAAPSCAK